MRYIEHMNEIMSVLLIWLSFFTPSVAHIGLNALFFTPKQIRNSLFISAMAGLVPAILVAILFHVLTQGEYCGETAAKIVVCLLATFFLCAMNERLLLDLFLRKTLFFSLLFALTALLVLTGVVSLSIPIALLLIYLGFSVHDMKRNWAIPKTVLFNDYIGKQSEKKSAETTIAFASHPNVYVFFLESMQSESALKQLYGSDAGQDLREFLTKLGLKVYDNAFSATDYTADSKINVFEMRYAQAGLPPMDHSPAFDIFKQNGYVINVFDSNSYIFGSYADQFDYCSFLYAMPKRCKILFQMVTPLFSQSAFWRLFSNGIDPSKPQEKQGKDITETYLKEALNHIKDTDLKHQTQPNLNVIHFGASHTDYHHPTKWKYNPRTWSVRYLELYHKAGDILKRFVWNIKHYDPNAVIVIMGDHGTHSLDYLWIRKQDPIPTFRVAKISRELLLRDIFSVLLAVKWPDGVEPKEFSPFLVNIFPYLFLALSKDEEVRRLVLPEQFRFAPQLMNFFSSTIQS